MAGFVILGMLAAFGCLCAFYAAFGLLLPRPKGGALVYTAQGQEELLLRWYLWLRGLGLLRCPLVLLDSALPEARQKAITEKHPCIRFRTKEAWIEERED